MNFKNISMTVLATGLLIGGATVSLAESELVNVGSSDIFVPVGFDDNDDIVAVVDGYLPSSCYKLEKTISTVDMATKTITLQQTARRWPGPCLLSLVPYTQVVNLGMLPMGDFSVTANQGVLRETLQVSEATSAGPDEFLYAPVESVQVNEGRTKKTAILSGRFTNSCMKMESVKVINSGKTIEVLPIMTMDTTAMCAAVERPFTRVVTLPRDLEIGRHLVHVRSLNGKSVNSVFSVTNGTR